METRDPVTTMDADTEPETPRREPANDPLSVLIVTSYRPEEIVTSVSGMAMETNVVEVNADNGIVERAIESARRTRREIRRRRPDILLLDCYEAMGAPAVLVAIRYDVPVVTRLVDDPWRKLETEQLRAARERREPLQYARHRASYLLNDFILTRSDGFVTVSTELRSVVQRRTGAPPDRIGTVPLPVTRDTYRTGSAMAARSSLGIDSDRVLLTVTNLNYRAKFDGVETVLSEILPLLESDSNLSYVVAGGGQYHTELVSLIENRVEDPDVRSRIHAPGYVDAVADLYALADVFAYVSELDGYPNVVLEAQTAGVPVVANDAHGMRDQITDGETGFLIDHTDPGALRRRVERLLSNPTERRRLGEAARRRIQRENAPDVISGQLEAFLTEFHATLEG